MHFQINYFGIELSEMRPVAITLIHNIVLTDLHVCVCRNALLENNIAKLGCSLPAARKTGTTICGVVYKVTSRLRSIRHRHHLTSC